MSANARIAAAFEALEGRSALIPYLCAGDPFPDHRIVLGTLVVLAGFVGAVAVARDSA